MIRIDLLGDAACPLPCLDGGRLVPVQRQSLLVVGVSRIEGEPFPAQQTFKLRMLQVIVVDPSRVLPDVLGGEGFHRHRLRDLDEFVAKHMGEQVAFATEVVVDAFFVHTCFLGNALYRRAIWADGGELFCRSVENLSLCSCCVPRHPLVLSNDSVAYFTGRY